MFHLIKSVSITPKNEVEEKLNLDVNINKKINIFFGIVEFSNIYSLITIFIDLIKTIFFNSEFKENSFIIQAFFYVEVVLIISIFTTGILYFCNKKIAYNLYFVQFFLRLIFFIPSFGILLMIKYIFPNVILVNIIKVICVILEVFRFGINIFIVLQSKRYV